MMDTPTPRPRSRFPRWRRLGLLAAGALGLVTFASSGGSVAQAGGGVWEEVAPDALGRAPDQTIVDQRYRVLRLNQASLLDVIRRAPMESTDAARTAEVILELPLPDGTLSRFRIEESPIMEPDLQSQFPEIQTFHGQGIDDPTATTRFDWTPVGFHAILFTAQGTVYVDPHTNGDPAYYVSFNKRDYRREGAEPFRCVVHGRPEGSRDRPEPSVTGGAPLDTPFGTTLRKYRAAVAATGEYTALQGGTVSGALAAITTTLNRVTGIFERELAVRLTLIANETAIIYTNANTDPYDNSDAGVMTSQNQANLDAVIGSANYDIGHVFSSLPGGLAYVGVVCNNNLKAGAESGHYAPVGDPFDVGVVAHEMGHQFGAPHSFNGTTGSCSGNRYGPGAFEPGSGSTIMSYAGICGAENLQSSRDDLFHAGSLDEMRTYVAGGGGDTCDAPTATGNTAPTANAGADFTIPRSTPFALTATASDANGDFLTYDWEETDVGTASPPNTDDGSRPIFRSFYPTTSPLRTFPKLSDILNNTSTIGESLPTTTRTLKFRVTVRDNRVGGGGTNFDEMLLNVRSDSGPFQVTAPNTTVTWTGGTTQTVTWNVANTNLAPVSTANVKISLSTDGGTTFPTVLLASTPNDGSQAVTVPTTATTSARIKVEAVGNVYFDVSNVNFTIANPTLQVTPTSLVFGNVSVGSTKDLTVTVKNTGGGTLAGMGTVTGTGFSIVGNASYSLTANQTAVLTVRFAPGALGAASGTLTLTGAAGATVPLSGTGVPVPTLTIVGPTTVDAGSSVQVQVANGPGFPRDWVALHATVAADGVYLDWKYLNGTRTPPATGLTAATVTFAMPTTLGTYNFRFFQNDSSTKLATSATVTVQAATTPILQVTPTSLAFGNVGVGGTKDLTLTVKNVGVGTLVGTGSVTGTGFSSVGNTSYSLTTNQTAVLTVRFAPGGQGAASGTFTLTGGAGAAVPLSGNGTLAPTLTVVGPTTVDAGSSVQVQVANGPGNPRDWVTLSTNAAADSVYLDWKYLNGTRTPPATGLTSATLTYTMPTMLGTYNFRFFQNDSLTKLATSATVTLQAPTNPVIQVTPTSLAFGNVGVGATKDLTVTVKNVGTGTLTGTGTVTGTGFSLVGNASYSLTTNQTAVLTARFAPGGAGAASGSLTLTGGAGATVPLSGNGTLAPTLTIVGPTTVDAGSQIQVQVANGPGFPRDWVALHTTMAADNVYVDWKYLNGTRTPSATGLTSATLAFTMPTLLGTYNFRFFQNDSSTKLATSATVTVQAPTNPVIQVTPTSLAFGNVGTGATKDLTVTVKNVGVGTLTGTGTVTGTGFSLIGNASYSLTANQTAVLTVRFAPGGLGAASGTLTLTGGAGATVPLSGSGTNSPTLTIVGPTTVMPGASVQVQVANGPGFLRDWVTLGTTAAADGVYLDWKYLNGTRSVPATGLSSATLTFAMPGAAGTYNFRFFQDNSLTKLATSATVTVQTVGPTVAVSRTTANPGEVIQVTISNGPGSPRDWVTLNATAAADNVYLDWKYLNGTRTPPATGLTAATLNFTMPTTLGTYNFRFFQNDSSVKLATSPTVTVGTNAPVNAGIVSSFAAAPVINPDGTTGIGIRLVQGNQVPYDPDLNPSDTEFAAIKAANFSPNRAPVYHYMISSLGPAAEPVRRSLWFDGLGRDGPRR